MALPAGVTTATCFAGAPVTFSGGPIRAEVSVRPSVFLVHTATGTPLVDMLESSSVAEGVAWQSALPHTDQAGFQDEAGNAYTNWYYTFTIQYFVGHASTPPKTKTFQLTTGQSTVDLDKIPSGVPALPYSAPQPTVSSVVGLTGPVTGAQIAADPALTATYGTPKLDVTAAPEVVRDNVEPWSGPTVLNALTQVQRRLVIENDATPTTHRTIGLGSSVGVGPNGGTAYPNDTVVAKIHAALTAKFNRLGLTWTAHNGSVNGTTVFSGSSTDYEAAKTAAGGVPTTVPLVYGMNEGQSAQYHAGLTFGGVYSTAVSLIQKIQADGADPIMVIGPHPHTVRATWTMPEGVPVSYPATDNQIPDSTLAESIVSVASPTTGEMVPASYRHLRVNEALRRAAAATGCLIIDAEPYWFDAIAEHGEDALFNVGEIVHPNLFGFQQSYHKAIADFARALNRPTVLTGTPPSGETVKRIASNETYNSTTRATSAVLQFAAQPNATYEVVVDLDYTVPTAQDIRISWEVPSGATGRARGIGPSVTATTVNGSEVVSRSILLSGNMPFGGNTSDATAYIRATVSTGSTGGTVGLQIGLDVTGGTATVYAGSMLRARKIA